MSNSGPIIENGVIAGNLEDKYGSRNPVARALMRGFLDDVAGLVRRSGCTEALEVGCGEGMLSIQLYQRLGLRILGTDFSKQVIELARNNAQDAGVEVEFQVGDVYGLNAQQHQRDLVICCEVLEHLDQPERALRTITQLAPQYMVFSVPREPLWRGLNMLRGKYWGDFGNTPGHLQHWSKSAFTRLIEHHAEIVEVRSPLPWTIVLARRRG